MHLMKQIGSKNFFLRYFVATPLILSVLVPVVVTDIVLELYHRIAFPIFGIRRVNRFEYIRILDRERLPYLTWYEKFGCAYCGYVNGWLHYASTITGRTESYFCAISHLKTRGYKPSEHEKKFMKYGDEGALRKRYHAHHLKYDERGERVEFNLS